MFPLTFDNSTRSTSLDAANLFALTDSTVPNTDSFQSHLQPATTATSGSTAPREERDPPPENAAARAVAQSPAPQDQADDDAPAASANSDGTTDDEASVEPSDEIADPEDQVEAAVVIATSVGNTADVEPIDVGLAINLSLSDGPDIAEAADAAAQTDASIEVEQAARSHAALLAAQATEDAKHEAHLSSKFQKQMAATNELQNEPAAAGAPESDSAGKSFTDAMAVAEPVKTKEVARRGAAREVAADHEGATAEPALEVSHAVKPSSDAPTQDAPERKSSPEIRAVTDHDSLMTPTGRGSEDSASTPTVANRFAQHWLARGTDRASQADGLPEIDHTRFIERVTRAFQAAEGRDGVLRLRLSPPELGALRLELKLHEGALTAHVEAETPAAKALLLEHLPVLRERLAEQGVRVEQFDVDLLDRRFGQTPEQSGQREPEQHQNHRPGNGPARTESGGEGTAPVTRSTFNGDGRLNVIV